MQRDNERKIRKCMDTCYLSGFLFPQAGLLTGFRVITIELVECLILFILLLQQFHHGVVICFVAECAAAWYLQCVG